jgi:hypothetical protein
MGGSSYSDDFYSARVADKVARGVPTFDHDHAVKTGTTAAKVHDNLNVHGKIRESRDSAAHPESLAIAVVFDETGSMGSVPRVFQEKIPQLMGLLLRKSYVDHPQVLIGAVGDYFADKASIQLGQFESGAEMDDDITKIWLEGNGGGTQQESYQNVFWYFANRTSIDCFEKRGKKGYLFVIGDESPYQHSRASELTDLFGVPVQSNVTVEESIAACQEKYNVFFVIPAHTSYGRKPELKARWDALLGPQNVILIEDETAICETIATAVGLCEGTVDMAGARRDLADLKASGAVVDAVSKGLAPLAATTALARSGSTDLPESDSKAVRL